MNKTDKWISDAASGKIANQQLSDADIKYAEELQGAISQGYTIKPMVVNVSIPLVGQSGNATAVIIPIK